MRAQLQAEVSRLNFNYIQRNIPPDIWSYFLPQVESKQHELSQCREQLNLAKSRFFYCKWKKFIFAVSNTEQMQALLNDMQRVKVWHLLGLCDDCS